METSELQQEVLKIIKLPLHFDKEGGYLWDADDQMVAEVRGWGHLQKFPHAEDIQDELGQMLCEAFNKVFGATE